MKTYTYSEMRVAHRAGAKGIPLDEALRMYEALFADVAVANGNGHHVVTAKSATPKPAKVAKPKETKPKQVRTHIDRDESKARAEKIVAYLQAVGEGGARIDRIADHVGYDKDAVGAWLYSEKKKPGARIKQVGKGTFAFDATLN